MASDSSLSSQEYFSIPESSGRSGKPRCISRGRVGIYASIRTCSRPASLKKAGERWIAEMMSELTESTANKKSPRLKRSGYWAMTSEFHLS
jgi:hypothetical protein